MAVAPQVEPAAGEVRGAVRIVAHSSGAGARTVVSGAQVPLSEGVAFHSGSRVVTPANGGATFLFSTGTSAALGERGDMTLIGDGIAQMVRLDSGSVDLHVAKLAPGQRFLVDTPDTEIEVRGTQFRVAVVAADPSCGGATWTRVVVSEGVVEVRHAGATARVAAGEQWPSACGQPANVRAGAALEATAALTPAHIAAPPPVAPSRTATRRALQSSLGAQNNLFAQAVAAKRRGDTQHALAVLDRFLAKYPASPLTESVMVERMRLLRSADAAAGLAAATEYLARYPNGFAHAEAESMVSEPP
jgi:hypothetical protein